MEQRLSVITLGVADLDRSRRFYESLGWRRGNSDAGVVFFQLPGLVVALFGWNDLAADAKLAPAGEGFRGIALAYNARSREEVDAVLVDAVAAGATLPKPGEATVWGGYAGYFADPDGHLWEVAWNPFWSMDERGGVWISGKPG